MERAYGANPPPGREWEIGKTIHEIKAIHEEAIATGKTTAEVAAGKDWIKRLPPSN